MPQGAAQTNRQSQVQTQLSQLREVTQNLREGLGALGMRIEPVLDLTPKPGTPKKENAPQPPLCSLANSLQEISTALVDICTDMDNLRNNIEL